MSAGVFAADRYGPCEVRVVVGITGCDVHQQEMSLATGLIILKVMQNAVVFATGDDWGVGELASPLDELTGQFGFHFEFSHPWLDETEGAAKPFVGDGHGFLQ